jgi:hypothetical protein
VRQIGRLANAAGPGLFFDEIGQLLGGRHPRAGGRLLRGDVGQRRGQRRQGEVILE